MRPRSSAWSLLFVAMVAVSGCSSPTEPGSLPRLSKTHFLAFGDSLTEGVLVEPSGEALVLPNQSYPSKLEVVLRRFYPGQDIRVANAGVGGENLRDGLGRLPAVLDSVQPQVLLLLEGINGITGSPIQTSAGRLEGMVAAAQTRGVDVLIAKLLPQTRFPERTPLLLQLNVEIERIALSRGLGPVVETYQRFAWRPSLIGSDGLHPTREGYTAIAQLFFQHITSRYDARGLPP